MSTTNEMDWPVLVVDDEPTAREIVSRWLRAVGFQTHGVATAAACLDSIRQNPPAAICLDLVLPDSDGLELLTRIKALDPTVPVVVLTGHGSIDLAVQAVQGGAWDFLTKPVEPVRLQTVVRNAVSAHAMTRRLDRLAADQDPEVLGLDGRSAVMRRLRKEIHRVAGGRVSVLIYGETGTGKEIVARAIHGLSTRADRRFVPVNCAAMPEGLQDSELFGHERAAFTGALQRRIGRFEQADGGTVFLDEIAELTNANQSRLLRVLQERSFYRIGGTVEVSSDFRLVAATHRDLRGAVVAGRFREDLFFRVAVAELTVPPLRDRLEDIPDLVDALLPPLCQSEGRPVPRVEPAMLDMLAQWHWPGNVRELQSTLHAALLASHGDELRTTDLTIRPLGPIETPTKERAAAPLASRPGGDAASPRRALASIERTAIFDAIQAHGGNLAAARRELQIGKSTLYRKLLEYGVDPADLRRTLRQAAFRNAADEGTEFAPATAASIPAGPGISTRQL